MRAFYDTLARAAQSSATVLLQGESGTGKELAARAIHDASPRAAGRFVKIDCASLPEHLLESELFGYEKGAFTGAFNRKPGRLEMADQGTLFLDEIGELPLSLQAKLLRLLQDREFERLGSTRTQSVDVRIVAATHRDLQSLVARGQFRADLFYRLHVVPLWLPPLRARREDVVGLVRHFCQELGPANGRPDVGIDGEALMLLRQQGWPGNVRQLRNVVERVIVMGSGSRIQARDVSQALEQPGCFATQAASVASLPRAPEPAQLDATRIDLPPQPQPVEPDDNREVLPLHVQLRAVERRALERALDATHQNRVMAARLLGISRTQLYAKLGDHGLVRY